MEVPICDLQGTVCEIKTKFFRCQIVTLKRIPKMIELTKDEIKNLRSQFVISSWGEDRYSLVLSRITLIS